MQTILLNQAVLKVLTRLVESEYGDKAVIAALRAAWNNDDPDLHKKAWESLTRLGIMHRDSLIARAKENCQLNDWITARTEPRSDS